MNDILHIEGSLASFRMDIYLPEALSGWTMAQFRKALKVIGEDYIHCDDLIVQLKTYINEKLEAIPEDQKLDGKIFWEYDEKVHECEREVKVLVEEIKNKRTVTFMPLSKRDVDLRKDKLKEKRESLRHYKGMRSEFKLNIEKSKRYETKLKKYKEILCEIKD